MKNIFKRQYECLLPANLHLEELLQRNPPVLKAHMAHPDKLRDRIAFIMDRIERKSYDKPKGGKKKLLHYENVSVCAQILRDSSIPNYNQYLTYLANNGVLKLIKKGDYRRGCSIYQLGDTYTNVGVKRFIIYDQDFLDSIYEAHKDPAAISKYPKLYKDLSRLSVDWPKAEAILDNIYGYENNSTEHMSFARRNQVRILERIDDSFMATFKLGRTNRLTTTISNLRKELRYCLLCDSKPLVGVDIKNSIPFFTIALLEGKLFHSLDMLSLIHENNPRLRDRGISLINEEKETHTLQLSKIVCQNAESFEDVERFKQLVLNAEIYEEVAKKWNENEDIKTTYDRNSAKKKLMKILNSQEYADPLEKQVLRVMFPNVILGFEELNEGFTKRRNGKGKQKWKPGDAVSGFAHVTQKLESRIVLDEVCGGIKSARPEIPIFTLHDCIFTTEEHFDFIETFLKTKVKSIMGYEPKVEPQ